MSALLTKRKELWTSVSSKSSTNVFLPTCCPTCGGNCRSSWIRGFGLERGDASSVPACGAAFPSGDDFLASGMGTTASSFCGAGHLEGHRHRQNDRPALLPGGGSVMEETSAFWRLGRDTPFLIPIITIGRLRDQRRNVCLWHFFLRVKQQLLGSRLPQRLSRNSTSMLKLMEW
eukprot:CAMPEP_0178419634 /NCGR_PEP_ID=MMETSP0689_2-20121128/25712_1 /TAXON_ID=160604 /ORGANISM="Amphidinium massartii, Strain CS-259" /LENGTH=173 /DNA_ID=CAMNT_0020041079 /DNA_START=459 /DNA_END=977 /DNA_ORIENTATION=-